MKRSKVLLCVLLTIAASRSAAQTNKPQKGPHQGKPPPGPTAATPRGKDDTTKQAEALRQSSVFSGGSQAPWRGSQVVLRNALTALSLDPSADLTYNPYFAMSWSFRPWWWFSDRLYARAQFDVTHELTEPDTTTYDNEAVVEDLRLVVGGSGLWTIPYAGVLVSADLVLTVPTSKASRARTLVLGIGPGLRLSRRFAVLGGLVVGYNLRVNPWLHRYATGERQTPLIPGCGTEPGGCDPYLGTGLRNPALRLTQMADASIRLTDWLGVSLVIGHAIDWIHDIDHDSDEVSIAPLQDQDRRFLTFLELEVSFRPIDLLEIGVGYSALHPQLAPDSSYYVPFFNRYSILFVDLKLHVERVVSRIQRIVQ